MTSSLSSSADTRARGLRAVSARAFVAAAAGLLTLATVGTAMWLIGLSYSPVPFWDFWPLVPFLDRALHGHLRLVDVWAQYNEHRIVLGRLQFWLEYAVFGGRNYFLLADIVASLLALVLVLVALVWRETHDRLLTWLCFCAAAIALLSPGAYENLTWPFQVPFVQAFTFAACAVAATVAAARSARMGRQAIWIGAATLAAVAATYSLANGLLVWIVLIALAVMLRVNYRLVVPLAVVGAGTATSYLWHFHRSFDYGGNLRHPLALAEYAMANLGSFPREAGVYACALLGVLGVCLLAALCVIAWRERNGLSWTTPAGAALGIFILLTSVETAVGRVSLGPTQALSSRYTTASALFWLGLLLGFLRPVLDRLRLSITTPGATREIGSGATYLSVAVLAAFLASLGGLPSRQDLHQRVVDKRIGVLARQSGVDDPAAYGRLFLDPGVVAHGMRFLETNRLGPWAPGGLVDDARFSLASSARAAPSCHGHVDQISPVDGGVRIVGWITAPDGGRASRQLAVLTNQGSRTGLGFVGTYRRDVVDAGAASSSWTGFVAYARPTPRAPFAVVLVAGDRKHPACTLRVSAAR